MLKALLLMTTALGLFSSCSPSGDLPRFHEVDSGKLYRSGQPDGIGYAEMEKAGIRTVVKLNTDRLEEERKWASSSGIKLIEIPLPGLRGPAEADEMRVQAALENPALQPVLVHCEQGHDRTGLAVALYRMKIQGWSYEAARKEWYDLGHSFLIRGMDEFLEDHR